MAYYIKKNNLQSKSLKSRISCESESAYVIVSSTRPAKISLYYLAVFLLALMFAPNPAQAQLQAFSPVKKLGAPRFSVDWSQFRSDSAWLTKLEVYYKISNSGLVFIEHKDGYQANYRITIRVFSDNRQVGYMTRKKEKVVKDLSRTRLYSDFVLNSVDFNLEPGKYKIVANLEDLNSSENAKKEIKIKLSDFTSSKHPKLSGIEFLYSSRQAKQEDKFFRKGNLVAVPLVDRGLQGGADGGPVLYYFEVYSGANSPKSLIVETQISHQTEGLVYHDSIHVAMEKSVSKELRSVNLTDFIPGEYEIKVSVYISQKRMKKKKPNFTREDSFSVNWSLLGRVRHDYKNVIAQLSPIARPEESAEFKKANTAEARVKAWTKFWLARDPSPGTKENEALLAYYARVKYADEHFSSPHRTGWKSDRGRVFLKQGRPDEVIDEPVSINIRAYQIWYYYNVNGELLRFRFLDEFGDEDFQLQYPFDGRIR